SRDDRNLHACGFEQDIRKSLSIGRQCQHIHDGIERWSVLLFSQEMNARVVVQGPVDLCWNWILHLVQSHEQEVEIRKVLPQFLPRPGQFNDALVADNTADEPEYQRVRWNVEAQEGLCPQRGPDVGAVKSSGRSDAVSAASCEDDDLVGPAKTRIH